MELEKVKNPINLSLKDYIENKKSNSNINIDRDQIPDYSFVGDRMALEVLSKFGPVLTTLESMIRVERDKLKADLLGGGVKVTPDQFPKIYNNLVYCSKTLGIPVPEVFIHQRLEINAFTLGTNEDSVIVLNNGLVDKLEDNELRFVLGHECGHIQNKHVTYSFLAYLIANITTSFIRILFMPAILALKHWSRQAEITCDRAGLICAKDIEAGKAVMIKSALGSKELSQQINMEEYLNQLEDLKDNIGKFNEFWISHPYLPKRVQALELYEKSENFISKNTGIVGEGMTIEELDEKVRKILKIF